MFNWFKKSPQGPVIERNILHGHDLDKWHYIGYIRCSYISGDVITRDNPVFLFVSKQNPNKRSYKITGADAEDTDKNHGYIQTSVKPWTVGEGSIYRLISGKTAAPSEYLKSFMLEHYGCEWSRTTHWWEKTNTAKYKQATTKQKSSKKKTDEDTDNVIKVDFRGD